MNSLAKKRKKKKKKKKKKKNKGGKRENAEKMLPDWKFEIEYGSCVFEMKVSDIKPLGYYVDFTFVINRLLSAKWTGRR